MTRPAPLSRPVSGLLIIGTLPYSAWLLESLMPTGLDPLTSYVSELSARDRPSSGIFRASDFAAGTLFLLAAGLALPHELRAVPRPRWAVTGWSALILFALGSLGDALLPMSCAPTTDLECSRLETAGLLPFTHQAHTLTSTAGTTTVLIGALAPNTAAHRYNRWPLLQTMGGPLLGLAFAATLWTLTAYVSTGTAGAASNQLGLAQRTHLLLIAAWTTALAASIWHSPTRGTAPSSPDSPKPTPEAGPLTTVRADHQLASRPIDRRRTTVKATKRSWRVAAIGAILLSVALPATYLGTTTAQAQAAGSPSPTDEPTMEDTSPPIGDPITCDNGPLPDTDQAALDATGLNDVQPPQC
ncbi:MULTISPECIES: DUF998 domain-containing protein [unclassified Streptomyces]|uniref:DUF998 domain-containing protein n=1 Tax=unclassified Streptomyces TaxID=2593676 RepID=UPI000DC797A0|nr:MULTISPECIES: DUF998 domain-containing protein [unclassified Streptomyces]AWZ07959.1 hypothetical protein DRB89_28890 [Streptomyces sp. ICC4]AWZ14085.1 hypothetical protein DRB96_19400 [Streptomyces sp. ICC1]